MPVIPFPYEDATPVNKGHHAPRPFNTDIRPSFVSRRKLRWETDFKGQLFQEEDERGEDFDATPLIVKALATPSGIRRQKGLEQHCQSCTCHHTPQVSRREMLSQIADLYPSDSSSWNNNQVDYVEMSAKLN